MVKGNPGGSGPESYAELRGRKFERRKNSEILFLFGFYFGLSLLIVHVVPRGILSEFPFFRDLVDALGGVLPGVERFGQWSAFPEAAQLTYSLQIVLIPILVAWGVVSLKIKLKEITTKRELLRALAAILFYGLVGFALVFLAYPASPELGGMFGQISDSAYASKFWFAFHGSWLMFAASMCFILFYVLAKDFVFWLVGGLIR